MNMLPFRKILFPVDYSDPCRAVVPYVRDMAEHFGAELSLLHAYGAEALAYSELPIADPDLPAEAHAHEQDRLRCFAKEMFPGQHVDLFTEVGEPGAAIHSVVQHQGADLVMLSTHGRGPVRRFLLGSVTAKVLHDLSTAVWTGVGSHLADHAPSVPCKSVLCALDDSEEAETVLRAAASVACAYNARLSLVRVLEPPPPTLEFDFGLYRKDMLDAAGAALQELKTRLGLDAPHAVIEAAIADGVREAAVRRQADLIVTGRGHAQNTFSRMWSSLYPIVRESPCPVLSI
jgi:nucleotide-binding universal stress UspA family protein